MHYNPIVLGVVGDSAAGKTTLADGIAQALGADRVARLNTDDYRRFRREELATAGLSALHPDAHHLDIVEQHLALLKQGEPVLKPRYNAATDQFEAPAYIEPRPYVVVEGCLAYAGPAARGYFDVKLYLEPREETRIGWKMAHDTGVLGRSERAVVKELAQLSGDAALQVRPQRQWADMVISFFPPPGSGRAGRLNASLILRPTLPPLELEPLLESEAAQGLLRLELQRDMGLPVDRLDINGGAADGQSGALEDLLWRRLQRPGGRRAAPIGMVTAGGAPARSQVLALTQLLAAAAAAQAAGLNDWSARPVSHGRR